MKITAHRDNLLQLTLLSFVNVYFVRENSGYTLVDTALENCAQAIVQTAQRLDLHITRILPTHAHADHIGGLDALNELLPEAEVIMPARDARFLYGDMSLDADEPQDKLREGWVIRKTRASHLIHEGDRVGSLEMISTPGHTPGHAAFLDTRDRTLIAGDAFDTIAGVAASGTLKPLFPLVALESARKLRMLEPSRLAVGHGRVLDQPLATMDHAIEIAARKLGQLEKHYVTTSRA